MFSTGSARKVPCSQLSPSARLYFPPPPLPGSVTLHHWQQLAQPNLGGILVPRPGVLTKDFRPLDIDLEEVYSLTDLEEDEVEAASFQLLPTSMPAKAMERPGGEREAQEGGRCGPQSHSALLCSSPRAPPLCSSLSRPFCLSIPTELPWCHEGRGPRRVQEQPGTSDPPLSCIGLKRSQHCSLCVGFCYL